MKEIMKRVPYDYYTLMFDEHTFFVWDNIKEERLCALEVTNILNQLTNQNNKMKQTLEKLQKNSKENNDMINELFDGMEEIKGFLD